MSPAPEDKMGSVPVAVSNITWVVPASEDCNSGA